MTVEPMTRTEPKASVFSLAGTPVLSAGRYDEVLASTDEFVARVKVYAEGGENATHTHLTEDHLFFVLAGEATFSLGRNDEEQVVVGPNQGVMVPRGSFYHFLSSGEENLVMVRVGSGDKDDRGRTGPDGVPMPGHDPRNKHVDGVPVPGRFFEAR